MSMFLLMATASDQETGRVEAAAGEVIAQSMPDL